MSITTPNIRPYKVGHESLLVVGVEGVVDRIDDDTLTINGITLPRRLDRDRGVRYLSMVWPDGDETTCDREHCTDACAQPRHRSNRAVDACGFACGAAVEGAGTCSTYVGRHRAEAS